MKNYLLLLYMLCGVNAAFSQLMNFPKDSVKTGNEYTVFYTASQFAKKEQLIVALQGCYSDGNTFANETLPFAQQVNATLVSIENNKKVFLNTKAIQAIIEKTESHYQTKYQSIYFLGFSCNAASGIAYGLENDIRFKGVIAFMPALDRVPFSYYDFKKDFAPIAIITGNKDFAYKPSKKMVEILTKYNPKNVLLLDIPNASHDFNIPERAEALNKAYNFIHKK